jgi:hypothetical protein
LPHHHLGQGASHVDEDESLPLVVERPQMFKEIGFRRRFHRKAGNVRPVIAVPAPVRAGLVEVDDVHGVLACGTARC